MAHIDRRSVPVDLTSHFSLIWCLMSQYRNTDGTLESVPRLVAVYKSQTVATETCDNWNEEQKDRCFFHVKEMYLLT
jgi:hypothetical protein